MEALISYFNGRKCCDLNLGLMMKTKAKEIGWEQIKVRKSRKHCWENEKETFWRLSRWILALGDKSFEVSWIFMTKIKGVKLVQIKNSMYH